MLIFYEFVTFSVDILSELSKRANAPCNRAYSTADVCDLNNRTQPC